ncbi:MAG: hypothetical protein V7K55_01020 [Nostoc sp.]|uniref:hypothetical protein n=1 Tax=Nostoc sp. TaxID=1180 RepID=UPI002FF57FBB
MSALGNFFLIDPQQWMFSTHGDILRLESVNVEIALAKPAEGIAHLYRKVQFETEVTDA